MALRRLPVAFRSIEGFIQLLWRASLHQPILLIFQFSHMSALEAYMVEISDSWKQNFGPWIAHVRIRGWHRVILSLTIGQRDFWWPSLPNQVALRRLFGSFSKHWRFHSATMKSLFAPADSLDFSILTHVRNRGLHGWNNWFLKTQFWTMNRSFQH